MVVGYCCCEHFDCYYGPNCHRLGSDYCLVVDTDYYYVVDSLKNKRKNEFY